MGPKPLTDEQIEQVRDDRPMAYSFRNDRWLATLDEQARNMNAHEAVCMKALMDETDEVKAENRRLRRMVDRAWAHVPVGARRTIVDELGSVDA